MGVPCLHEEPTHTLNVELDLKGVQEGPSPAPPPMGEKAVAYTELAMARKVIGGDMVALTISSRTGVSKHDPRCHGSRCSTMPLPFHSHDPKVIHLHRESRNSELHLLLSSFKVSSLAPIKWGLVFTLRTLQSCHLKLKAWF